MGIFDFFSKQPKRFVSQKAFERNLENQMSMTPQTLQHLRADNVTPEKKRKLEFFFYTNTTEKAAALTADLLNKKYEVEYRPSASNAKLQIITGWSSEMPMSDSVVLGWTKEMCSLGFTHDCDFDGWGTNAE